MPIGKRSRWYRTSTWPIVTNLVPGSLSLRVCDISLRLDQSWAALKWPRYEVLPTYWFSPMRSKAKCKRSREAEYWLNTRSGRYGIRPDGVGLTDFEYPGGRLHTLLLRRLSEIECGDDPRFVPNTTHGIKSLFARKSFDVLDLGCEQQILRSWEAQHWWREENLPVHPDPFLLYTHTFWIVKRPRDASTSDGSLTLEINIAVCPFYLDYLVIVLQTPDNHVKYVRRYLIWLHTAKEILNQKRDFLPTALIISVIFLALVALKYQCAKMTIEMDFNNAQQ